MKRLTANQLELARRLLARELGGDEKTELASAVGRVHARFHDCLTELIGSGGAHALFARSVQLASTDHPCLGAIDLDRDFDDERQAQVVAAFGDRTPEEISQAAVALSATMIALLEMLIGEALTSKVLQSGWPDLFVGNEVEEKKTP